MTTFLKLHHKGNGSEFFMNMDTVRMILAKQWHGDGSNCAICYFHDRDLGTEVSETAEEILAMCQREVAYQSGHSEFDQYVMARASNNADKPYDQRTCARYPWAAAARIAHLERVVAEIKK